MWKFKIIDTDKNPHYFQTLTAANRARRDYGVKDIVGLTECYLSEEEIDKGLKKEILDWQKKENAQK